MFSSWLTSMIGLHVSKAGHVLPCFPMVFVVLLYPCCRTKHKKNHFASYLSCTELVGYFCFTIWGSAAFSNVCFFLCSSLKTVLFLFFRLPHNSFFFLDFFFSQPAFGDCEWFGGLVTDVFELIEIPKCSTFENPLHGAFLKLVFFFFFAFYLLLSP